MKERIWFLVVIDPEGYGVGGWEFPLGAPGMGEATGWMADIDKDGKIDRVVNTGDRKIGDYLLIVTPGPEISPTDTYGLQFNNLVLAKNVPFSKNILSPLYP